MRPEGKPHAWLEEEGGIRMYVREVRKRFRYPFEKFEYCLLPQFQEFLKATLDRDDEDRTEEFWCMSGIDDHFKEVDYRSRQARSWLITIFYITYEKKVVRERVKH